MNQFINFLSDQSRGCVTVHRDLLFIYDKDAVVLGRDAGHRVLTGHLSLIVAARRHRMRKRWKKNVRKITLKSTKVM